ncbi:MAG: NrfD/PsrC family molybdoenzyme membrane anchor subunit, partial [FCB group bacterium]|nr:NrfD/PsrC family molybdoenzyme membrane anchor subunit [FCB group bacterium]
TVPTAWGFAIINFVWWIGIGHAGTLISAILLLMRQQWRTSINRFAEAMTLFAVMCAGMFPILHLGRPWFFYWLMPYPNTFGLWPQFRSPLVWDVFAVTTYATVSLLFWYTGLIPDLATMRDRAKNVFARLGFGIFALGWRNSAKHWARYEVAYLLLAALSTPLVISVHSVVSLDFAVSLVPGWHNTIFPPYFVAGAIYAGFAMVLTLVIPIRYLYNMHDLITEKHIDNMCKVMLATGLIVVYGYMVEAFIAWYSGNEFERFMIYNRMFGPYAAMYWALIFCNALVPQLLWARQVRTNTIAVFLITLVVGVGMWLERYVIIVTSLHRDFLPSSWDMYAGTRWDWATYIGTMGLFMFAMLMFIRLIPMISIFEVRELWHSMHHKHTPNLPPHQETQPLESEPVK